MKHKANKFSVIVIVLILIFCASACSFLFDRDSESSNESAVIDFSTLSVSCLGDSITMDTRVKNYPTALKEEMNFKIVSNHGISWSTIGYQPDCHCHKDSTYNHDPFVFRYSKIVNSDIIIVNGGINDFGVNLPLGDIDDYVTTTFYGALNVLCSGLQQTNPNAYIFFITGFKYRDNYVNSLGLDFKEYNKAIVDVCVKYNIDCMDVYNNIEFNRDLYTYDNIHPNDEFISNIWVPEIAQFIKDNYKK